jgi:hypothetical protein
LGAAPRFRLAIQTLEGALTDNKLMSRRFRVLASTADRHFIELVALHTRTAPELTRHLDCTVGRILLSGKTLCELNFLTVAQNPEGYEYDPQGLAAILGWIKRIESIRSGVPHKG